MGTTTQTQATSGFLTGTAYKSKSQNGISEVDFLDVDSSTVQLYSHDLYAAPTLALYAAKYGLVVGESLPRKGKGTPFEIPVTEFLQHENIFYSDVGRVLQVQYADILKGIYSYLDPREMDMVKTQSLELRKKKVY